VVCKVIHEREREREEIERERKKETQRKNERVFSSEEMVLVFWRDCRVRGVERSLSQVTDSTHFAACS
jgi:hypothetical protein